MRTQLLQACVDAGVCNGDNVKHVALISAKSGFGIEDLITALQKKWGSLGDVYLIGRSQKGTYRPCNVTSHAYKKATQLPRVDSTKI